MVRDRPFYSSFSPLYYLSFMRDCLVAFILPTSRTTSFLVLDFYCPLSNWKTVDMWPFYHY